MRTKTKKGLLDFKRKRSLGSVVPLLFLATGFNVVSANGVETFFNNNYENDGVSVVVQTITGTVIDADGIPLPGATVVIKGTSKGTQTDFDGNFVIDANAEDVLEISYVGFKTQEVVVGDQTSLNISLEQDIDALNEVVVIGYGTAKKSDLTGAVSQIKSDQYDKQPITRVEDILQGRSAGVSIQKTNGSAGAGAKIRVRGVNSITGSQDPLVVVDGVFGGDLRTINPDDIASIEVLKDAASLTLFGSQGSNGVILVTTKKGKGKPQVKIDYFSSISVLRKKYEDRLSPQDFARGVNLNRPDFFSAEEIEEIGRTGTDYEKELFTTAHSQNISASVSGGSDNLNYFISGNYIDQEGIVITNNYERFSSRANLSSKVTDKLTVGLNLYGSRETEINDPNSFDQTLGGLTLRALAFDPTTPVLDENGNFNRTALLRPGRVALGATNAANPIAALRESNRKRVADRLNATFDVKYKFTNSFKYNLIASGTTLNENINGFIIDNGGVGNVRFDNRKFTDYQISNIFNWNKTFGIHGFDVTGVYEIRGRRQETNAYEIAGTQADRFFLSDNENVVNEDVTNGGNVRTIESYLGRINYDINKSLFLTGALRVDRSSNFLDPTGYFASGAIAYSFNRLAFIEEGNGTLSNLKLRASWGQTGNQDIDANAIIATDDDSREFTAVIGLDQIPGSGPQRAPRPNVTWESTEQTNFGVDLGFVNNRINFSFDYFIKDISDLLLDTEIPVSEIITTDNVGEIENKGFDFTIGAAIIEKDNFTWDANLAFTFVENEIKELSNNSETILLANRNQTSISGSGANLTELRVGGSIGDFVGQRFLGIAQEDSTPDVGPAITAGDPLFLRDEDGNIVLEKIGNGTPTTTWGLNNTFVFKNWDLNIFVQGAHGFEVYNQARAALSGPSGPFSDYYTNDVFNAFTPENPSNEVGRLGTPNNTDSSRFVEDGSYVRLSNVTLGHTLKEPFKGVNYIKIYASGQNLLLITDFSGYDPEGTSQLRNMGQGGDINSGINFGAIPNPLTINLGVKLGF